MRCLGSHGVLAIATFFLNWQLVNFLFFFWHHSHILEGWKKDSGLTPQIYASSLAKPTVTFNTAYR